MAIIGQDMVSVQVTTGGSLSMAYSWAFLNNVYSSMCLAYLFLLRGRAGWLFGNVNCRGREMQYEQNRH